MSILPSYLRELFSKIKSICIARCEMIFAKIRGQEISIENVTHLTSMKCVCVHGRGLGEQAGERVEFPVGVSDKHSNTNN